jgi:hypothetical protein
VYAPACILIIAQDELLLNTRSPVESKARCWHRCSISRQIDEPTGHLFLISEKPHCFDSVRDQYCRTSLLIRRPAHLLSDAKLRQHEGIVPVAFSNTVVPPTRSTVTAVHINKKDQWILICL